MTADFCPLVRDKCHGDRCMAWRDGDCLIVAFLGQSLRDSRQWNAGPSEPDEIEVSENPAFPSADDLAGRLVDYVKRVHPEDETVLMGHDTGFWKEVGIKLDAVPVPLQFRVSQMAREILSAERDRRDKADLPQVTARCLEWARERGLKRVTLSDIEVFLGADDSRLGYGARRSLYASVNLELKTLPRR